MCIRDSVIDKDDIVRQRGIKVLKVLTEEEDIFVIEDGLEEGEKIILEGIRQVRPGDKIEYEFANPTDVLSDMKHHAE